MAGPMAGTETGGRGREGGDPKEGALLGSQRSQKEPRRRGVTGRAEVGMLLHWKSRKGEVAHRK